MSKVTAEDVKKVFPNSGEWEEVKPRFFKLENPGDAAIGVLVKKEVRANTLKPGSHQAIYTLVQDDGQLLYCGGRTGEPAVIAGLESVPFGTRVKLEYIGEGQKKPGKHAPKLLKVYKGQMKLDVLKKFTDPLASDDGEVEFA